MVNSPFTLLQERVDPIVEQIRMETPFSSPLMKLFKTEIIRSVQSPEAATQEIWQAYSHPAVSIGDKWEYQAGQSNMATGSIKYKKMTIELRITEDEMVRIKQNPDPAIVARLLRNQMLNDQAYLESQELKWMINPWDGATTDVEYDSAWTGMFYPSNTGTISNPSDLNAVAATPYAGTALKWSGAGQTANNMAALLAVLLPGMVKQDFNTKLKIPQQKLYLGVDSFSFAILKSNYEILNSTTGQRSEKTYMQMFEAAGITVVECPYFDPAYAMAAGGACRWCFFADPMQNCSLFIIPPPDGEMWSDWREIPEIKDGKLRLVYSKSKKVEFAVLPQAFRINTSATAASWFKAVWFASVTPYATS